MKKIPLSKAWQIVSSWRIKDYIRQLSIVILGIIITFTGSDAISSHSKQKDLTKSMQLLKEELKENKEELQNIEQILQAERNFSTYIIQYEKNFEKVPTDTLLKYQNIAFQLAKLSYSSDALEALKASALIQEIKNKELPFRLILIYKALESRQKDIASYYGNKAKRIDKLNDDEQFFNMRIYDNLPAQELWKNYFKNFHFKSIIYYSNGYFSNDNFTFIKNYITETIEMIDKEY